MSVEAALAGFAAAGATGFVAWVVHQEWAPILVQALAGLGLTWLLLLGANLVWAKRSIARERDQKLTVWRAQFRVFVSVSSPFQGVTLHLVAPHGSDFAAFRVTVRDPRGVTQDAQHVGSSSGYDSFLGGAIDWEYPSGSASPEDGPYRATWFAVGHDEPIGQRSFTRSEGRFLVQEPSDV